MQKLTYSDVHKKSIGLNPSYQVCIFDTDETTVIANLEKPVQTSAVVALSDADASLTAAQIANSKIFTIAASTTRTLTLALATEIIAAVAGYSVGMEWDLTVVNTSTGSATLAGATGTTLVGSAVVAANTSGTWRVYIASATTVVLYRK